ncbi:MAG: PadR family transcriptional regulator [Alteromonas sp.]
MMDKKYLGELEQVLLLTILRLNNRTYGVEIRQAMLDLINRDISIGALYTTLGRLESKGLVNSAMGEASPERGGRAKKYYSVSAQGQTALKNSLSGISTLSEGLSLRAA